METIDELRAEVARIKRMLGVVGRSPLDTLVLRHGEGSRGNPGSTVWQDGEGCFHFLQLDPHRGDIVKSLKTRDAHDVLFEVAENYVEPMAMDYELAHRVEGQDFRRIYFARLLELMGRLGPEYERRERKDLEGWLRKRPFKDDD